MIHFRNRTRAGVDRARLVDVTRKLLHETGQDGAALSLTLVGDAAIRKLNREHRGKDKPTDVLSFPLDGPLMPVLRLRRSSTNASAQDDTPAPERLLGDVVISVDTARRQAAEYGAPLENEIHRLLIHGILHVLGHDHEDPVERAAMEAEERRLAAAIGMPWPYDE